MQIENTVEHENRIQVIGCFEGKPFELNYYPEDDPMVTVDGQFSDDERLQIWTQWEIKNL